MRYDYLVGQLEERTSVEPAPRADPVADLRRVLLGLDARRAELAEAGDVDALAWGAADLEAVVGDLRDVHRATRADLARIIDESYDGRGRPHQEVEGLGRVEVWGGPERKNWQSPALLKLVLLRALVDEDGAFVNLTPLELVDRIFDQLSDCISITGSLSWKVGQRNKGNGLRGLGVEVSDFCEEVEAPRLARIPKRS